jgi:hypothetical protein
MYSYLMDKNLFLRVAVGVLVASASFCGTSVSILYGYSLVTGKHVDIKTLLHITQDLRSARLFCAFIVRKSLKMLIYLL